VAEKPSGQRTEKPTPKRLREARQKGQIPRSPDLVGWVGVLVASFVLPPFIRRLWTPFREFFGDLGPVVATGDLGVAAPLLGRLVQDTAVVLLAFLTFMGLFVAVAMAVQGGVTLSTQPLRPKWERISPLAGFKRLVSSQSLVDTAKALFRLAVLATLVLTFVVGEIESFLSDGRRPLPQTGRDLAAELLLLVRLAALIGVVIGLADYAYQRWKVGKQLKMTKEEVKRENKNTEGDPLIKGRRRSMHQRLSQNQMLAAVQDASVVVVNPTHVAVALAYETGGVPTVVAKGADAVAARIRERAFEAGVPVVEARPLARILHDLLDVGAEIPSNLYEAVAIVIAFVMRTPNSALTSSVRTVRVPRSTLGDLADSVGQASDSPATGDSADASGRAVDEPGGADRPGVDHST
jgi:flagellar biosynthetic protein FlhB